MNPWPFVIAVYVIIVPGTALLIAHSFYKMRRAERLVDKLKKKK